MNTKEILNAITENVKPHTTIKEFSDMVVAAKGILDEEYRICNAEIKAQEAHNAEMKSLQKSRMDNQSKCVHWKTTYYPDASGNNDGWTQCNFCKAEL